MSRSSIDIGASFCAICGKLDEKNEIFMPLERCMPRERRSIVDLTSRWQSMTIKVGNDRLLNILSSGDTESNELFYHGHGNVAMWNECLAIDN